MQRRTFLTVVSACGTSMVACSSDGAKPASGPIAGGLAKDVPVGHFAFLAGQPVVLARDAGGLYALNAICTHEDCDISKSGRLDDNGLSCDCHGSQFDKNGGVRRGPAARTLDHYRVDLAADGRITVQAGAIVGSDVRTPVPAS